MSPYKWPLWWRLVILFNVSFYNLLGNAWSAGLSPIFGLIMREFNCSQSQASDLTTFSLLMLGISNLFALPLIALFGKRYTILASLILFIALNIWSGEASDYESLKVSRILGGLAGGLVEALGPTIVHETFRDHQLARAMAVYVGFLAAGSALGPIFAGIVAQHQGSWRWYLRILSIATSLNLLASILMLPETTHKPELINDTGSDSGTSNPKATSSIVENAPTTATTPEPSVSSRAEWISLSFTKKPMPLEWSRALPSFFEPLQMLIVPRVLVTVYVFGLTIGWTVIISILLGMTYAQPPLLWGSQSIGLLNVAPLLGLLIGLPFGGYLSDLLFIRSAKDGKGPSPASRLPVALLGMLISPSGCLVIGYGLKHPDTWIQVCVGWGMLAFGLTASANVLLAYAVNTIPSRAGDIGVLVNFMKNTVAFGVSYASLPWMNGVGPVKQFATMAALLWLGYLMVFPVWLHGKTLFKRSYTSSLA
ncbi:MFS domain-containing protein [Fusarium falciforme]|uniref:MFS domain-containing protein n=1 Tax=Fusarium falciforme TaxID=195108 RepID=UPI0023004750|nr:MFS domain-containing protein [Fusarium falciforme]WAO95401.1 MFS domain-containing protein [Fusarium falciforme]